ncbi:hypothetical protein MCOR20_005159 [Pyricularia oryzae]|nr:hypothetical protein MCOR20_005159 [Pyricularia oryzae]
MSKPELLGVGSCLSSTCLEDRDKLDRIWSSSPNSQSPNSSPQPTSPHTAAAAAWARSTVVTSPALTPSPQRKGANDSTSLSQLHHRLRPLAAPPQEAITTTNNTAAAGSVIVFKQDQFDANRHATAPGTSFSSELAPAQSPPPPVSNSRATVISSPDLQLSPHEHPARLNCDENDSSATRPKLNPKSPDLDVAAVAPARNIGELNSNGLHTAPLSPVITGDKPGHLGDAAGNNDLALEGAATVAPNGRDRPEEEPERSEGDGQEANTDFADATWDEDGDDHFTLVTPQSIELKPAKGQVRIVTPRRGSANNMIFGHKQQGQQDQQQQGQQQQQYFLPQQIQQQQQQNFQQYGQPQQFLPQGQGQFVQLTPQQQQMLQQQFLQQQYQLQQLQMQQRQQQQQQPQQPQQPQQNPNQYQNQQFQLQPQEAYQQEYPDENVGRQSSFVGLPLIRRTSTFSKSLSKSSDDFKGIAGVSPDPGPGPGARSEQELFSQIPIPPIPQDPEPGTSTQLSYTQTPIHMSKPIFPFTPVAPAGNFEVKSPVGQPGRYVEHGWQVDSPVEAKAPPGKSFGGVPQQQPKSQPPAPQPQTRKATVENGNTSPPVRNQTGFSPPIPTGNGKHLHTPPTGGPGWTLQETKPMEPLRAVRPRQSQLNMGDQYALDKETGASSRVSSSPPSSPEYRRDDEKDSPGGSRSTPGRKAKRNTGLPATGLGVSQQQQQQQQRFDEMSPLEPPKPIFDPNGITRTQTNESVESNGSLLGKLRSRFNHEKAMTMSANTAAGNAPSGGRLSVDQTRRNADNVSLAPSYDGTPGKKKNRGSWLGLRGEKKAGEQTEVDGEASGEQLVSSPVKSTTFGRNGNGPQSAQAAQTGPQQPGGPAAGAPGRPSTSDARPNGMPVTAPQGGAAQPGQKQSLSNKLSGLLNTITDSKPPKQPQHQPPSSSHGLNPVMEEQSGNQNRFGQGLRPVTAGAPLSSGQQQSNMTGFNSGQTQPGQPQSGAPVQTELSNKQESMKPSQQPGAQPRIGLSAHPALVGTQGPATRQRSDTANSRPFTSASNMPAQQTSDAESMNLGLPPRTKTGGAPSIAESERSAKRVSSTSAFLSGLFGIKAGKGKESKSQAGQSQMTPLNQTGMGGSAPPNGPQPGQPVPIQLGRGMPVPGQPFLIQQQPGQPPIVVQPGPPGAPQPQHTQRMVLVPGPDGRLVMMPIPPGMEIQMRPRPGLPGQQPSMTLVPTLQPQQQVSHGAPGSSPPVPQGPPGQKPTQWPLGSDGSPQPNQSQQASTNATPAHSPPMAGANGSQWLASGAQGQVAPGSMAGNAQIQQQFQPVQQVPIRGQSPDHRTLPSQMLPPGASADQSAALNQPFANAAATQHTERKPAGLQPHAQNPNDFGNTERAGTPPKSKHDSRRSSVSSAQHSPQLVPHGSPHVRRVSTPSLSLGQHGSPGFQPAGVSMQMGATAVPGTQSAQAPARTTTSPLPSPGLANQAQHPSTSPQASPGLVSQMGQLNLGQGPPQGIQMQGQAPGQMTPGQQPVQAQQPPQQQPQAGMQGQQQKPQVLPEESPAIPWQTYNNQAPAQGGRRASNTSGALTEHQSSASRFFNKLANVGSGGPQQRQEQKADKKADKKMEKKAEKKKSGLGLFNMKSSKQEEPVAAQAQPVRLGPPPGGPQYGDKGPPTMYGQPINGLNGAAQQQPQGAQQSPPVGAPANQSQVNQQPIVQGQQQGQQQLQAQGPQGAQAQGHKPMGQQSQLQPGAPTSQAQGSGIPNTAGFTQSPPLPGAPFYSPGAVPEPLFKTNRKATQPQQDTSSSQPKQNAATQPQSNEPTYAPVGIPAGYATVRSEGRMLQHGGSPYLVSHGSFPNQYVGHPAFQSPQNTPPQQQQQQQWSNSSTPPLGQQQQQPQPQQYQQPGNYQMGAHGMQGQGFNTMQGPGYMGTQSQEQQFINQQQLQQLAQQQMQQHQGQQHQYPPPMSSGFNQGVGQPQQLVMQQPQPQHFNVKQGVPGQQGQQQYLGQTPPISGGNFVNMGNFVGSTPPTQGGQFSPPQPGSQQGSQHGSPAPGTAPFQAPQQQYMQQHQQQHQQHQYPQQHSHTPSPSPSPAPNMVYQGALQAVGQPGSGRPTPSQSPDPAQPQTTSPPLPHIMHPGSPHSYPLPESARATTFSPVNPAAGAMRNPPLPQRSQMGMIPEGAAQQQPQLHQQQSMQHLNDVELQRQNSMISQVSSVHPVGGFASANEVSRMTSGAGSSEGSSGGQTAGPVVSSAETSPVPEQHSKMARINSQQTNQRYAQGQFENIYDTSPRLQSNTHSSPPPMVTASPPPPMPVTSQAASPPPHAVYSPPVSQAVYPPIPQPVGPPVRSTDQQAQQQDQLRAQSASPPSQSSNAAPAAAAATAAAAVGPSVAVIHSHSPEPPSPTDEEIRKVGGTTTGHLTVDGGSEENGAGGSNGELGRKPTIRATSAEQYEEAKRKMLLRDLEEKIPVFIQDDPPPIKKEEEATVPKMSATSYPGQEWNPYGDGFETWED